MRVNNKTKKRMFVCFSLMLAAAFGMVLSGCAPAPATPAPTTPTPAPATPSPKIVNVEGARVAFLLPNVGPWYNDKWFGFKDEAEKLGMAEPVMYSAGGYGNVAKQVSQVEDAIAAGFDGIVLHATSGSALIPPVKKALEAGIYVSTEHSPLDEAIVPNIWEDPEEAGHVLGYLLANLVGGEGKVFMINGPPGQMEALAQEVGMIWVFDTFYPGIEYIGEWPAPEVAQLLKVTEDLLTAHPDVAGIYFWPGPYSGGAVEALKAAGIKPGQIPMVTSYATPGTRDHMMEGWFEYIQPGAPVTVGRTSARNMAAMFRGEEVPLEINVPMVTINQETAYKFDESGWYWAE